MQAWVHTHFRSSVSGVFAISFLLLFLLMDRSINMVDEGLVLVNAIRTLHGDLIHRDFYSPYGPGAYYILALLFRIDSHWFILERIYGVATMAGIVATSFGLLVDRTRLTVALLYTAMCGTWMLASPYYLYPMFPSVLLALIGSALLLRWFEGRRPAILLLAGATAGATALFRYEAGFFLAAAHFAAVAVVISWVAKPGDRLLVPIIRAGTLYAAGAAIIFLPFAIYYLETAPIAAFSADIIDYPIHYYAAMRGLPFPRGRALLHPTSLGVYIPVLTVLLAVVELARIRRSAKGSNSVGDSESSLTFLVVFVLLTAVFYYKGIVRVSFIHMMMSIVPSLLVLAVLIDRWWDRRWSGRLMAAVVVAVTLVPPAFAAIGLRMAWSETQTPWGQLLKDARSTRSGIADGVNCSSTPKAMLALQGPDYRKVSEYMRRFSRPDEKIFVGLNRHDKIFANPVSLYFSAERQPGTHWHQFDPGIQTRADIQAKIISDLRKNGVRWVIRDASFDHVNEPNQSSRSSGVHVLDRYLERHYHPVASTGKVQIWLINGAAAPKPPLWSACGTPI